MVLCVGAVQGDTIEIRAEGKDEQEAVKALIETLERD